MAPIEQLWLALDWAHLAADVPLGDRALREASHEVEEALAALERARHWLEAARAERATVSSWFRPAWWRQRILARCFLHDIALIQRDLRLVSNHLRRVAAQAAAGGHEFAGSTNN